MIDFEYGDGLEVAFGGGRSSFLPNTTYDNSVGKKGLRGDGRNLPEEWVNKTNTTKYEYVSNLSQFRSLKPNEVDHVLGKIYLFASVYFFCFIFSSYLFWLLESAQEEKKF